MDIEKFDKIIDFAIAREKDAIRFYEDLRDMGFFKEKLDLLDTLVEMERVHIDVLESFRLKTMKNVILPRIENLDSSGYPPEPNPTPDMSYRDILDMAISREDKSMRLYTKIAHETRDPETKKLFLRLAAEEGAHKTQFEKLVDEL
jgi:rubrerythrin